MIHAVFFSNRTQNLVIHVWFRCAVFWVITFLYALMETISACLSEHASGILSDFRSLIGHPPKNNRVIWITEMNAQIFTCFLKLVNLTSFCG